MSFPNIQVDDQSGKKQTQKLQTTRDKTILAQSSFESP